jgi:hypothetical protein
LLNESKVYSDAVDSAGEDDDGPKLIFIGGSHAARMAAAAAGLGMDCVSLAKPGYRVTEAAIEQSVKALTEELSKSDKRTVVIFHIFDNSVFFCAKEDGSRTLPVRGKDGIYHVPGKLEFALRTTR